MQDSKPQLNLACDQTALQHSFGPVFLPDFFLFLPLVLEHRDPGEELPGDELAVIKKKNPPTIPTYTDMIHIYSTVEGMSSQMSWGEAYAPPLPANSTHDP